MAGKIGEGHAAAMARLGLAELRNAMNLLRESVADKEIGLYGTATQGEIAEARGGPGQGYEQEGKSTLEDLKKYAAEKTKEAEQKMERDGPDQDLGLER